MNDLHDLMRDRLSTEHVDLAALADGATRQGRRIRRIRRTGVGLATAAVVAGVGFGTAAIAGHEASPPAPYAAGGSAPASPSPSTPAAPRLHEGQVLHLTANIDGRVVLDGHLPRGAAVQSESMVSGVGDGFTIVVSGPYDAVQRYWSAAWGDLTTTYPGVRIATSARDTPTSNVTGHAISIDLDGWTCGVPGDDKTTCTGPHGVSVGVTWYQGHHDTHVAEYGAPIDSIPMLGGIGMVYADGGAFYAISAPTADGTFLSVGYVPGVPQSTVGQVASSLRWK